MWSEKLAILEANGGVHVKAGMATNPEGKEEEGTAFVSSGNTIVYDHREAYKRRFLLLEVTSTDDDSALSESTASESSESGHSSHRGSSGDRRRKRKKATIKYTTKSALEGGDGRRTLHAATLKRTVEWLIEKEVRQIKSIFSLLFQYRLIFTNSS